MLSSYQSTNNVVLRPWFVVSFPIVEALSDFTLSARYPAMLLTTMLQQLTAVLLNGAMKGMCMVTHDLLKSIMKVVVMYVSVAEVCC
jgi:hypothetical protein